MPAPQDCGLGLSACTGVKACLGESNKEPKLLIVETGDGHVQDEVTLREILSESTSQGIGKPASSGDPVVRLSDAKPREVKVKHPVKQSVAQPLTTPLIEKSKTASGVDAAMNQPKDIICAAWIIEDALDGQHADEYPRGKEAARLRKQVHKLFYFKQLFFYTNLMLVLMMFVEVPLWCQPSSSIPMTSWTAEHYCPVKDVKDVSEYKQIFFSSFVVPPKYSYYTELSFMTIITFTLLYEKRFSHLMGPKRRLPGCMPGRFLFIAVLMWVDSIYYYYYRDRGFYLRVRFAPYGRLLLFFYGPRVRSQFSSVLNCIDEFISIVVFLFLCVAFFAYLTYTLLDDISDTTPGQSPGDVANDPANFGSFPKTLMTFFTLMTGTGFPDNICLVVKQSHWYALLFYPFIGLTAILFTNLMLAVVYNAYSGETKDRLKEIYCSRYSGVAEAFYTLSNINRDGDAVITYPIFTELVGKLSEWPRFKGRLRVEDSEVIFRALDTDGSGELSLDEFFDACSTLLYTISTTNHKSRCINGSTSRCVKMIENFVENGCLSASTELVLCANTIFIGLQSYYDFQGMDEPPYYRDVSFFFTVIYMVEVSLKLYVFSFSFYWSTFSNRFDFGVSWVLFLTGLVDYVNIDSLDIAPVLRFLNILRVLRLLRLLTQVPCLRSMCITVGKFCQVSGDMVILFFISTLLFAIAGVQAFGGLLHASAPELENSAYLQANYDVFNFNDMLGAFTTLTVMLINGYLTEYTQAIDLVMPLDVPVIGDKIGEIYCGLVFLLSVNIAFNIFTAFLIDIFVSLQAAEGAAKENGERDEHLEVMKEDVMKKGEVLHFIESPEVLRLRTMTHIISGLDVAIKEAQDASAKKYSKLLNAKRRASGFLFEVS